MRQSVPRSTGMDSVKKKAPSGVTAKASSATLIVFLVSCWYFTSSKNAIATQQLVEETDELKTQYQDKASKAFFMALLTSLQIVFGLIMSLVLYGGISKFCHNGASPRDISSQNMIGRLELCTKTIVIGLVGMLHFLGSFFTNMGFMYGSATLVQVVKLLEPVETLIFMALVNVCCFRKSHGITAQKSMGTFVVVGGALLLLLQKGIKTRENPVAVVFALLSGLTLSTRNVTQKSVKKPKIVEKEKTKEMNWQDKLLKGLENFMTMNAVAAFPSLIALLFIPNSCSIISLIWNATGGCGLQAAIFHGIYNMASISVLSMVAAQTHSLLNVGKRITNVIVAAFFFNVHLQASGVIGLVVALLGGLVYSGAFSSGAFLDNLSPKPSTRSSKIFYGSVLLFLLGVTSLKALPNIKDIEELASPIGEQKVQTNQHEANLVPDATSSITLEAAFKVIDPLRSKEESKETDDEVSEQDDATSQDEEDLRIDDNNSKAVTNKAIMVSPFNAYKPVGEHRTCKKTVVVRKKSGRKMKWVDQPFKEHEVDDIGSIAPVPNDDMLCLQVGPTVGAVVTSRRTSEPNGGEVTLISSAMAETFVQQLEKRMVEESNDIEFEIINRKIIGMHGRYLPSTPEAKVTRTRDGNIGNFIWAFGATRMMNPYTTEIKEYNSNSISALIIASANILNLAPETAPADYEIMMKNLNPITNAVRNINKPTIVLGIGIQAEFANIEEIKRIKLYDHQVTFMNQIAERSTGKSVSVRGEFTETACINAGVENCISLGCPSLSISRSPNLGQVLETKWNNVEANLKSGQSMRLGITLPAITPVDDPKYQKIVGMLFSLCEAHDCYFIMQARYDRPQLLKYAGDRINKEKILYFNEEVDGWFEFIRTLDFVVSTRIHGGMAGISNEVPTVIIPTDLRILELINAMVLPHISFEDAIGKDFTSLDEIMEAAGRDFTAFETNRRNRLKEYKRMLESIGVEMDPALIDIILDEEGSVEEESING
mmetsp:Transcript_27495/g.32089  ORF Transcript_27495/g.32089 Transcript_27495/m.32089 type:complete len:997 (-) Transcript_27495:203-3193(-)